MNSADPHPSPAPASGRDILVMKFGGTSVAGEEGLRRVAGLAAQALERRRVLLVASAMSGITDLLVAGAERRQDAGAVLARYRQTHRRALAGLDLPPGPTLDLERRLDVLEGELGRLLQGVSLLGDCSPQVLARICGLGERASCALLAGLLGAQGRPCLELDPTRVLVCQGDPREAAPVPARIRERLEPFRLGGQPLGLLPGFIGGTEAGEPVLLGRGGSDLTAALAAAAVDAAELEIWTDVDGVYTADPRLVEGARCLERLSFEEAMELAFFGAKVLHPRTLGYVRGPGIPTRVRNTLRPTHPGTLVSAETMDVKAAPRGLTLLPGMALLEISGSGLKGVLGLAARAFSALARRGVNIVLITQGSSECNITICVRAEEGPAARDALAAAFEAELAAGLMDPLPLKPGHAVVSVVGDGMGRHIGVSGAFFGALGSQGCNVVAIAQGSSGRSISAVVREELGPRALAAVHRRFFGGLEPLELYLMGVGLVGKQFLVQLQLLQRRMPELAAKLKLCAVSNSRRMRIDPGGLDPATALDQLAARGEPLDEGRLRELVRSRRPDHAVMVDCTASQSLADGYQAFVEAGFHLVSASKKANSGPMDAWRELRGALDRKGRVFHYETNVGAGLPILGPLRDLRHGGDRVLRLEGILSGSLSYIYGRLDEGAAFSEAVAEARKAGFTEPDPRDDLSGLDVARKALILYREMGFDLELDQVAVESPLPGGFDAGGSVDEFMARLPELDAAVARRLAELRAQGRVLRYAATVTPDGCQVGAIEVDAGHPLFVIRGGENALCLSTEGYYPHPMVVRGYGAGAAVTATGVLADVLKIARGARP
ncbi:MAG: bifunctional aspartate kinase/homoserine dehydrogenase I [Holophaga sp.]|jgi:aspartokinase/homoserine dehydrogenase 1